MVTNIPARRVPTAEDVTATVDGMLDGMVDSLRRLVEEAEEAVVAGYRAAADPTCTVCDGAGRYWDDTAPDPRYCGWQMCGCLPGRGSDF